MSVEAAFGAIFDDLGEVSSLGVAQRREQPVVDRQQVQLGQSGEHARIRAVAPADGHLVQQPRHPDVAGREAPATGALDEGTGQEAHADPGRAGDEQVVMVGDPRTTPQTEHLLAVEPGAA